MAAKKEVIMEGPKRLQNELMQLLEDTELTQFRCLEVEPNNIYKWFGLLLPEKPPYDQGAFKLEIDIPVDYPFKPPRLHINTKIYHPNVNERGQVSLPILEVEHWKPTTRIEQVLQVLLATINDPQIENPFRMDVTGQYMNDRVKFNKMAELWVSRYSEHRPTDAELAAIAKKKKKQAK